jgi:MFS family permease
MTQALELLRREPRARLFFLAHAQSSFGTGAGYIALLLLAYQRFHSPWAISAVLLAEFLPAMFLGPVMGAAADRWSRRSCLIAAEVMRAVAFVALAFVGSFEATVALALLAGAGNALFNPTVMAALPSLVDKARLPAATSLYGTLHELGYTAGPGLAAITLLLVDPSALMLVNGITFGLSALVIARLRFGQPPHRREVAVKTSLLREAWSGLAATAGNPSTRTLLLASSVFVACLGMINVGELLLANKLGANASEFSILVGAMGIGIAGGSLLGARGSELAVLKRGYLTGLILAAVALVLAGVAPSYLFALPVFALAGIGNGVALVNERLLLQRTVPDELVGRVFGVKNAMVAWSFAISFLSAGAIASALGVRTLFIVCGIGAFGAWAAAALALRRTWEPEASISAPASSLATGRFARDRAPDPVEVAAP